MAKTSTSKTSKTSSGLTQKTSKAPVAKAAPALAAGSPRTQPTTSLGKSKTKAVKAPAEAAKGKKVATAPKAPPAPPKPATAIPIRPMGPPKPVVQLRPEVAPPPPPKAVPVILEAGTEPKPPAPRPTRPPAPITGTAAMKTLAQRHAATLRPATDPMEMSSDAARIIDSNDPNAVLALGDGMSSEKLVNATCKTVDDILAAKPDLLVGLVDRFVVLIASPHKRTIQSVALALPVMARVAPARVARHLQALTERFEETNEVGKDGLVSTFAALCMASVAYQKRLEPVLDVALSTADAKTLQRWAEIILPSLKGEPHARARAVVEGRLPALPRVMAQPIATFLGIKLRPVVS
jgi:hypothetical protein